jgi:uncharacterized membrane protein (DUF4010 family)
MWMRGWTGFAVFQLVLFAVVQAFMAWLVARITGVASPLFVLAVVSGVVNVAFLNWTFNRFLRIEGKK